MRHDPWCSLHKKYVSDPECTLCDLRCGYEPGVWQYCAFRQPRHPIYGELWWLFPKHYRCLDCIKLASVMILLKLINAPLRIFGLKIGLAIDARRGKDRYEFGVSKTRGA